MSVIDTNDNVSAHIAFLKTKGVTDVGRYYSSKAWKRITKPEATAISNAGLRIFVIFEDDGDPRLTVDRGMHDAQIALQQAVGIGQPEGSAIYFALEHLPDGYTHRDLPGIRKVGLPCYCVGVTPNSPHRSGPGTIGFPITIAGHPVSSGDVIIADQDGVVVVPQARLDEVLERLPAIRDAEAEMDQKVRDGMRLPAFLKDKG